MKIYNSKIIFFLLIDTFFFLSFLDTISAQENANKSDIQRLETKLMILEHYIKENLTKSVKGEEAQQAEIDRLVMENTRLRQEVSRLSEELKVFSSEILRMKIEIAQLKKGETISLDTEKDVSQTKPENKTQESSLTASISDPEVKKWAQRIEAPDVSVRMDAITHLSKIQSPQVVLPLTEALSDSDLYVRIAACKSLGRIKDKTSVSRIINLLSDESFSMRRTAHEALTQILGKEAHYKPDGSLEERENGISEWKKIAGEK